MPQKSTKNLQSNWLVGAVKVGLCACLFMPLIINSSFIFPFIFPKQAFFQIVVEILMALYVFLALRQPQYRPRSSRLFLAMLIYFAVLILSSVFGENTFHSFWSNYERMAGVINLFHYLAFLFIAANIFKTKEEWHRFFDFSILASVLQALYGLGQLAGVSSMVHGGGGRIDGTIGNSSFLAGYMLINALFALWLMLEKKAVSWRIFYAATIVLNIFIMYKTQTRGAALALVAAIFVLALFLIFASKESLAQLPLRQPLKLKKYATAGLVIIILAIGLIWLNRDSAFVKKFPTLARLTHISLKETTSQTRLMAWQMSLQGFKEHPIFGWGPENYNVLFNKYYNPNLYPVENWFDRSHNAYLDVLVHTGLVGLAVYLAIFVLAFRFLWRARKEGKINYQTAAIFTVILVAYAIQNIFLFDTQVTLLMIYSILAFIVFLSWRPGESLGQPVRPNFFFLGIVGLLAFFSIYYFNIRPGAAGAAGIDATISFTRKNVVQSVQQFKDAYEKDTFGMPEVASRAQDAAIQILSTGQINEDSKKMIKVAIEGMNEAINEYEPQNARFMLMLVNIYLASAQIDTSYLQEADNILQKAVELSPTRQELYFALAQLRMFQGRAAEALPYMKRAVELNEKVNISHWNYGIFAIALGQVDLGEAEIKKAKDLGHSYGPADIRYLVNAYSKAGAWPKIASLYQDWINFVPTDAVPYAGLAATYAQMGEKQKAKEMALQAAQIDPSFQAEADQFIINLGL
ncbi:O-antigen ligase family protein [Patescibacteria group bacterium]|nr:O-antigen ligase family protein [Patescibacteria group bacterium]